MPEKCDGRKVAAPHLDHGPLLEVTAAGGEEGLLSTGGLSAGVGGAAFWLYHLRLLINGFDCC